MKELKKNIIKKKFKKRPRTAIRDQNEKHIV